MWCAVVCGHPSHMTHAQFIILQCILVATVHARVRYCVARHCCVMCTLDDPWCPLSGNKGDVHTKYTLLMMVYGQLLLVEDGENTVEKPLTAGAHVMNTLKSALLELCN